ncbi:MAG: DNA polymerase/3'-5' exonuclease PolX [Pseudomonadota bacterium]
MDKDQVAAVLAEIAQTLELNGENPFKVRAYANAARTIEGLAEDLNELVNKDELINIKGIGRNLADHIAELLRTGKIKEYEKMLRDVPDGVKQMLAIPGLGPKKVHYLWKELEIKSIGVLELFCTRHALVKEPGFGAKSEEKILAGIEMLKRFAGKRRFDEAYAESLKVYKEVSRWPEIIRSDVAGSIRRCKEIVKDIDVLVSTKKPEQVMKRFVSMRDVESVIQHGKTKSEVMLNSGIQCDLRVVTDDQYPFALHYFTGSKEHNIEMRSVAKSRGLKLNEYGLFKGSSKKSLNCKDEAELFKALGMDFIPPELRENMGEIQAAQKHKLPKLIKQEDLLGVFHVHSTYSDGQNSIEQMALSAKERGYSYMVLADHSQAVTVAGGMKPADVKKQHKEVDKLNAKLKGFCILKGIEIDILADGALDYDDDLLATFDVVIAAIHSRFNMNEKEMTERIIKGISNPHVHIFAHPTGRLLLARDGYAVDLKRVIDTAIKHKVALEINAHPQRLDLDWHWCKYAKERGAKIAIGPDAHSVDEIDCAAYGVSVARKGWLEKQDVLNCLDAKGLLSYLKKK